MRFPALDDDPELMTAIRRYVTPRTGGGGLGRYMRLLNGNFLALGKRRRFLRKLGR